MSLFKLTSSFQLLWGGDDMIAKDVLVGNTRALNHLAGLSFTLNYN